MIHLLLLKLLLMSIFHCALVDGEFRKLSSCQNANGIWHTFEVTHEETIYPEESFVCLMALQDESKMKILIMKVLVTLIMMIFVLMKNS